MDTALRIRNMFIKTPLPTALQEKLRDPLSSRFSDQPVSVRSSAPGEDSSRTSFAGLHESFVNVRGLESILEHIRLVWASLWSDRAFSTARNWGLMWKEAPWPWWSRRWSSANAQGWPSAEPAHVDQSAIEAVYGLNQGLVDGTVEPDRWTLNRANGQICPTILPAGKRSSSPVPRECGSKSSRMNCRTLPRSGMLKSRRSMGLS